jgi:phosphomethylpyrimidine synthase
MMPRTFLSRRSLGEGGCSMKITEDVRKFAVEQKISEGQALNVGLKEKAREFTQSGDGLYSRV